MTPWLGHGPLVLKQLSRGSQKQHPSGASQTVARPWPVAWTVRWAVRAWGVPQGPSPGVVSPQASPEPCYELPSGQRGCVSWTQLPKGCLGVPDQPRVPPAADSESEQGDLRAVGPTWPVRTSTQETLSTPVRPWEAQPAPGAPLVLLCTQAHEECCSPTPAPSAHPTTSHKPPPGDGALLMADGRSNCPVAAGRTSMACGQHGTASWCTGTGPTHGVAAAEQAPLGSSWMPPPVRWGCGSGSLGSGRV